MKLTLIIPVICFLCELNCSAQLVFQKAYGEYFEYGSIVHQTIDGGYIILGGTNTYGAGMEDFYLVKTDMNGEVLWTKTFGSFQDDYGYDLKQTSDSGYVLLGISLGFGGYWARGYIVKTNATGDTLWTRTYSGPNSYYPISILELPDGGFILTGSVANYGADMYYDLFLSRFDAAGMPLWTKTYGGEEDETGMSISLTDEGGYIVAGYTTSFGAGDYDMYLLKTDAAGELLWSKTYGGESADLAYSVARTEDGYILAGSSKSFGTESQDIYVVKTDFYGDTIWTKTYGTFKDDYSATVQSDFNGGFIIGGNSISGYVDKTGLILNISGNGDTIWNKNFGGPYGCLINNIEPTPDRGYIATGRSLNFSGFSKMYLIKMDSFGNAICNQSNIAPVITNPDTKVSDPSTIVGLLTMETQNPATLVGSGVESSSPCLNIGLPAVESDDNNLIILPDPASDFITVNLTGNPMVENSWVSIFDISGKNLFDEKFKSGMTINIDQFASGVYFLRLFDGQHIRTQKFIIQ